MKIAVPSKGEKGLRDRVADTFSRAPAFTIVTIRDEEIIDAVDFIRAGGTVGGGDDEVERAAHLLHAFQRHVFAHPRRAGDDDQKRAGGWVVGMYESAHAVTWVS